MGSMMVQAGVWAFPDSGRHAHNRARRTIMPNGGARFTYNHNNKRVESPCPHRIVSPVDVVAHEEVVGLGAVAPDQKQLQEVVELFLGCWGV